MNNVGVEDEREPTDVTSLCTGDLRYAQELFA
jgi:hypothetical protein